MDPQHEEILQVLNSLVMELKKGIKDYNDYIQNNPNVNSRSFLEKSMVEMHQIAIKLNVGIEGIKELEILKHKLLNGEKNS